MHSETVSITILRPVGEVYDFLSVPANWKLWAAGLGKLEEHDGELFVQSPDGRMKVRFTEKNKFGVLDHSVMPDQGATIYVPMRVVANGVFAEVVFTLFQQPLMSDADFASDLKLVRTDLSSLKNILESKQ